MKRNGSTFFVVMVAAFITLFSTLSVCYVNADDYAYDYKVKYSKWQTKWTKYKLAGNQCREGYHFRSGKGSFHWSDGGKKSPSVSLGYSPDGNFHKFSVSVSLGNRTSNGGMEVAIEDKPSYAKKHMYKLYVKRKVKARQIKTYRKRRHQKGAKWKCYCTTNEKEILGVSLDPRSVGVYK